MQLIGNLPNHLASWHYLQLLNLLQQALQQGEYSGGTTFDQSAVVALQQAGQDFLQLPQPAVGQRVSEDCLNYPLSLLAARYRALGQEAGDFQTRLERLLAILENDSRLLDQILANASLQAWSSSLPRLDGATSVAWDFAMGLGHTTSTIDTLDPSNGVSYPSTGQVRNLDDGTGPRMGLLTEPTSNPLAVKQLTWRWQPSKNEQSETLYGADWAQLSLLETDPLIFYAPSSTVQSLLPSNDAASGLLQVTGSNPDGIVPTYLNLKFEPRRQSADITCVNAMADPAFTNETAWVTGTGWWWGLGWQVKGCSHSGANGTLESKTLHPCRAGDQVYLEVTGSSTSGTDGYLQMYVRPLDSMGNSINNSQGLPVILRLGQIPQSLPQQTFSGALVLPSLPGMTQMAVVLQVQNQTTGTWNVENFRLHLPVHFSTYSVLEDNFTVRSGSTIYDSTTYLLNDNGSLTLLDVPDTDFNLRFSQMFPAYRCSVDQVNWSTEIMLDPVNPYPDTETVFAPILMALDGTGVRSLFPIINERGVPTGLFFSLLRQLDTERLLLISTPANTTYGAAAVLEIQLERPAYVNALHLTPFSGYPATMLLLEAEGFTSNTLTTLIQGPIPLDKEVSYLFPTQLISKFYLHLRQENYTLEQYQQSPADKLRRDLMQSLQSSLPLNVAQSLPSLPTLLDGAEYSFGLESIVAENVSYLQESIWVSGPYRIPFRPQLLSYYSLHANAAATALCYRAYDSTGAEVDANIHGTLMPSGPFAFPFSTDLDLATVAYCDLYLKLINQGPSTIFQKFCLQVA